MRPHARRPPKPTSTSNSGTRLTRAALASSLGVAALAALAGCTSGNVGPVANPVTVVVPEGTGDTAPAPDASTPAMATSVVAFEAPATCASDDECVPNHTGGLCLPNPANQELSDAEEFLTRAMTFDALVTRLGDTASGSPMSVILQQVRDDMMKYASIASGRSAPDGNQVSDTVRQDNAWYQSGATQADMLIHQMSHAFSHAPIKTDAQSVAADIMGDDSGLHLDKAIADVQALVHDVEGAIAQSKHLVDLRQPDGRPYDLKSCAGAMVRYVGPDLDTLDDARVRVKMLVDPKATSQLERDLSVFARSHSKLGKDGARGTCLRADERSRAK